MSVNITDLIGQAEQLLVSAKAVLSNPDASAEDRASVPQMIEDAKALKAQAGLLSEIDLEGAQILSLIHI